MRLSADGTQAVFVNDADNLGTANSLDKVYRRGTVNDAPLSLVSRVSGVNGAAADADAIKPSISADGDVIAFQSEAENLSSLDQDETIDVFVRSMGSTTVQLVSRRTGAQGAAGDDISFTAAVSADGKRIAFASYADNMSDEDIDAGMNVYVRDRTDSTTTLVSREAGATGAAAQPNSDQPAISGNGRWVAFRAQGDSLSTVDNDAVANLFSRDMLGGDPFIQPEEEPPLDEPDDPKDPDVDDPGQPLKLLALKAKPKKFSIRKGTTITLRVSGTATAKFVLQRKAGKRWNKVGKTIRHTDGVVKLKLKGRFVGKKLRSGAYRMVVSVTGPTAASKVTRKLPLRVISR